MTTNEKTFTGVLQKKVQLEDKNGNPYWEIAVGTQEKPRTYRLFHHQEDLAKTLLKGKTYTITYTQEQKEGQRFPQNNVVNVQEATALPFSEEPVPQRENGSVEPQNVGYGTERRSIERQTALKAAVELIKTRDAYHSTRVVLSIAQELYDWLSENPLESRLRQALPPKEAEESGPDQKETPPAKPLLGPASKVPHPASEKTGYIKVFEAGKLKGYAPTLLLQEVLKCKDWDTWVELGGTTQQALAKIEALEKKV